MPRKPKKEKKTITVVVNGRTISVTMFPPNGREKSWHAYWKGLPTRRSTYQTDYDEAVKAVEDMLRNNGRRGTLRDAVLSDEEFDEIQRQHYLRKQDPDKRKRSEKSLTVCMEAITAFRQITYLKPITIATPDDCARFQRDALNLPKDWRVKYADTERSRRHRERRGPVTKLSPNTVVRWSVALQAAFERANRNGGKKCVRGVVPEEKLLTENPWKQFNWIEGRDPEIRQFDERELTALLDHFETEWSEVTVATAAVKMFFWSYARRLEIAGLQWSSLRTVGPEIHFDIVGKWGVRKWFRIPEGLFQELSALKSDSPFVFSRYNEQVRRHHENGPRPWTAKRVLEKFDPVNFGDWLYNRISEWSKSLPNGSACVHVFRKTSLQYARRGEDVNQIVAADAAVTTSVMMTNYVREEDDELRQKSNRTFRRIAKSLSPEVACRFGYIEEAAAPLKVQLQQAIATENWELANRLTAELAKQQEGD